MNFYFSCTLLLIAFNAFSLVYSTEKEELEPEPILLGKIEKLNKEWDDFKTEEYDILYSTVYTFKNGTQEEKKTLSALYEKFQNLKERSVDLVLDTIIWVKKEYKGISIIDYDRQLDISLILSSFTEEPDILDGFNSPKMKAYAVVSIEGYKVPLNPSVPVSKIKYKNPQSDKSMQSKAVNCSDIKFRSFYFPSYEIVYRSRIEKKTLQCFLRANESAFTLEMKEVLTLQFECSKDFATFPFDSLTCTWSVNMLKGKPWKYLSSKRRYVKINVNDYYLEKIELHPNPKTRVLSVEWNFRRKHGYYIFTIYLPISLLVFVAWLSFFLGVTFEDVQMKLSLVVTVLLTLVTVIQGVHQFVPKSSQFKASDRWSMTSLGFVIAAMVEIVTIRALLWVVPNKLSGSTSSVTPDASKNKPPIENTAENGSNEENKYFVAGKECNRRCINLLPSKSFVIRISRMWRTLKFVRIVNIVSGILFFVCYLYFALTHIHEYCSLDRFWKDRYFENVSNYSTNSH